MHEHNVEIVVNSSLELLMEHMHLPLGPFFNPDQFSHLGAEPDILIQIVLEGDVFEVSQYFQMRKRFSGTI